MRSVLAVCILVLSNGVFAADVSGFSDLGPVVKAVNDALTEAQSNNPEGFPDLTGVTLELSGTSTKNATGQVKFLIFTFGPGSVQSDNGTTLTVKLSKVPPTTNKAAAASVSPETLKNALAQAIHSAKVAFLQVSAAAGGSTALASLNRTNIQISLKFAVQKSIQAGVDTATLLPIGISLTGKVQSQLVQTVTLTFGQ